MAHTRQNMSVAFEQRIFFSRYTCVANFCQFVMWQCTHRQYTPCAVSFAGLGRVRWVGWSKGGGGGLGWWGCIKCPSGLLHALLENWLCVSAAGLKGKTILQKLRQGHGIAMELGQAYSIGGLNLNCSFYVGMKILYSMYAVHLQHYSR